MSNVAQVVRITDKLLVKEKENENSKLSHSSSLSASPPKGSSTDSVCEDEVSKVSAVKQEDLSSAKSDVFDSESPHYTDGVHSSLLEPGDSSYVFEHEQSDLSQDEEDDISKNLLNPAYSFPKIEDADYCDPQSSCYYGFQDEDQAFGLWPY